MQGEGLHPRLWLARVQPAAATLYLRVSSAVVHLYRSRSFAVKHLECVPRPPRQRFGMYYSP